MNIDLVELRQKAMQILTHLVEEIGPRPAGSPAESGSLDWLEQQFKTANLEINRFPVKYQPDPAFFPYYSLAAVGFLVAGLALPSSGWLCLILPLLVIILPEAALWLQKVILPFRDDSSNLFATLDSSTIVQTDIILCAHIDSARAVPNGFPIWQKWRNEIFYIMMRMSILLAIWGILQASGFTFSIFILTLGQYLAFGMAGILVFQDLWEQIGSRGKFTVGANDNASGVSILAALAFALALEPPKKLKVGFLFNGAEECGLHGARQFADHLTTSNLCPIVISVDMVGAGTGLRIITRSGTVFPVSTSDDVNQLLKRADPLAEFHSAPRRWGDFVPFARADIPVGHIENTGTPLSWATYHTGKDDLDVIDPELIQHVGEVLVQLIWILEKNKPDIVDNQLQEEIISG